MARLFPAAVAALALAACGHNTTDPFPLEVGFQPLEPCTAALPGPAPGDPYPETWTMVAGSAGGHDFAHSRAYVHAALADVWAAMQDPAVCRIHGTNSWGVEAIGVEPFPMSFVLHYTAGPGIHTVAWEITYRGGVLESAGDGTPLAYGMRGQKTWGTSFIDLQSISVGARPVAGAADVVEL
ncbi:MAG TPA: hypothetical protein VIV59_02720, partial [Anaeromyxobacteraceae bacterium]